MVPLIKYLGLKTSIFDIYSIQKTAMNTNTQENSAVRNQGLVPVSFNMRNQDPMHKNATMSVVESVFPPRGVLFLGAAARFAVHPVSELDFKKCVVLSPLVEDTSSEGFQPRTSVRSDCAIGGPDEIPIFTASLVGESGHIKPEKYAGIWQNIRTVEERVAKTEALKEIIADGNEDTNWIVTDNLIPLQQLESLEQKANRIDVVVCRLVTDPEILSGTPELSNESVEKWMQRNEFKSVGSVGDRLPVIKHRIWIRDLRLTLKREQSLAAQVRETHETAIDQLETEKVAQTEALEQLTIELRTDLKNTSAQYQELDSRYAQLRLEAEAQEASLREVIQSKQNELDEAHQVLAEKLKEIEIHQREQDRLNGRIIELKSEAETQEASLRDVIQSKQNELDDLQSKHESLVHRLEQECKIARQESALHRNNLDEMRKKYAELSKEFDTQRKNLAEIEVHLTAVCDEMGLLENVNEG